MIIQLQPCFTVVEDTLFALSHRCAAVIRSGAMWWTLTRHAQNNEEVSRTLLAMRDPSAPAAAHMGLVDRYDQTLPFFLVQVLSESPGIIQVMAALLLFL